MKRLVMLLFIGALLATTVLADSNAGEQVNWFLIGGSGTSGSSANYQVSGSLGQAVAGFVGGSTIDVNQGYWQDFSTGNCCVGVTGNVNALSIIDLSDLTLLIAYLTNPPATQPLLPCPAEANVNGLSIIDLSDLSFLISYLTNPPATQPTLPNCP